MCVCCCFFLLLLFSFFGGVLLLFFVDVDVVFHEKDKNALEIFVIGIISDFRVRKSSPNKE